MKILYIRSSRYLERDFYIDGVATAYSVQRNSFHCSQLLYSVIQSVLLFEETPPPAPPPPLETPPHSTFSVAQLHRLYNQLSVIAPEGFMHAPHLRQHTARLHRQCSELTK